MVPDHGGRMKSDGSDLLLYAPAEIHIVARGAVAGIESTHRLECGFPETHIAARDMLGDGIRKQDVDRAAGRVGDTVGNRAIAGRRQIGAADTGPVGTQIGERQIVGPVRIGVGVVVDIGHDFAARRLVTRVASV